MNKLNEFCPEKKVKIGPQDKPFINFELKQLSRRRQREYLKRGKTVKYKQLDAKFQKKYKAAAENYLRNKVTDLKESKPGKAYKILKDMGAEPGDCSDNHSFTLPNHLNLSALESGERISAHFASISSEYPPLNLTLLPDRVKKNLETKCSPPVIS